MAGRNFSIGRYFDDRCAEIEPLFAFDATTEREARTWRTRAMAKVRDLLGEMPSPIPLEPEIIDRIDKGSFIQEKIIFDADPHSSVPAIMLIPKDLKQPAPAVLHFHGQSAGKESVASITKKFTEQGYITFAFDLRCFGERADQTAEKYGQSSCDIHYMRGSLLGINLLALNIHDAMRAIDYLETRPEVDSKRIVCAGLDLGGAMSMWTTALDKRVKAAVISGYLCEFEVCAINQANMSGLQLVHALRRYFDTPDITALIAPRPVLIQSGTTDEYCPIDSARRSFDHLKESYEVWEKPENAVQDVFSGGHEFRIDSALKWLKKWL